MKRALVVIVVLLLLAAAGAVAWRLTRDTSTTAVRADDATRVVEVEGGAAQVEQGERPRPGTFTYRGSGSDHFSALGGASHEFPDEVPVVIELDAQDACAWTMHVVFVEEHVEERRLCTQDGAVSEVGFDRTTEFLGRRQTSSYECTDALRMPTAARPGARWRWTCDERRGGHVAYTGRYVGDAAVTVDGRRTTARHVRIDGVQDDDSTGRERTELWLLENGLPARFTSERTLTVRTPLGSMTTSEQWDYVLDDAAALS